MTYEEKVEDLKYQILLGHSVAAQDCDDAEYLARELVDDGYGDVRRAITEFAKDVGDLIVAKFSFDETEKLRVAGLLKLIHDKAEDYKKICK